MVHRGATVNAADMSGKSHKIVCSREKDAFNSSFNRYMPLSIVLGAPAAAAALPLAIASASAGIGTDGSSDPLSISSLNSVVEVVDSSLIPCLSPLSSLGAGEALAFLSRNTRIKTTKIVPVIAPNPLGTHTNGSDIARPYPNHSPPLAIIIIAVGACSVAALFVANTVITVDSGAV